MAEHIKKVGNIYNEDVEKSYVHTNPKPNTERPSYETIKPTTQKPEKPTNNKPVKK